MENNINVLEKVIGKQYFGPRADDMMDARVGLGGIRIRKGMRILDLPPNKYGPMQFHHQFEEQGRKEEEDESGDDDEDEGEEEATEKTPRRRMMILRQHFSRNDPRREGQSSSTQLGMHINRVRALLKATFQARENIL